MRDQDEAEYVLTNAFVMHDLGTAPAPHSISGPNTVSGGSLRSPKRLAFGGQAVFASTFNLTTPIALDQPDAPLAQHRTPSAMSSPPA